jgi:hypothetical protein
MSQRIKKSNRHIVLLISFLACYIFLSLFVDLFHNHEADCDFHDNCLACQWENQQQDNHSEFQTVLECFISIFNRPVQNTLQENSSFYNQTEFTDYFSRAPPLSI